MQGERKLRGKASFLTRFKAFAQRGAKTVNETRGLIDYLSTHPDIDPKRIYLVGASYGAVMGSIVMAQDKRLRAGVMVYGGRRPGQVAGLACQSVGHRGVAGLY
jgi:dienelactone hydrolase